MTPWAHMGPIWGPMGSMGLGRWALADGPWPIGLEDPPVGVYFRARGRWGPTGSMGLGDPPMGVSSYQKHQKQPPPRGSGWEGRRRAGGGCLQLFLDCFWQVFIVIWGWASHFDCFLSQNRSQPISYFLICAAPQFRC